MTALGGAAIITGAAEGLGRALAVEAVKRRMGVVLVDIRDCTESLSTVRSLGGEAEAVVADVSDPESMRGLADKVKLEMGGANLLINNAAAGEGGGKLFDADPDQVRQLLAVNVFGVFNGIHMFAPQLREAAAAGRFAHILNVGSEHSLGVPPHVPPVSAYTAAKYAVLGLTDTARRDFEGTGVGVSLLAPGWILTEKIKERARTSPLWAASIEPHAQSPELVAQIAFDGVEHGFPIIPTNPVSRGFVEDRATALRAAFDTLSN